MEKHPHLRIQEIAYIGLFVALLTVCAWLTIPFTIPFTMQTFAVFAISGLLGPKRGCIAVCVYILLGAMGLPVFNSFTGGMGVVLGATGGYMLGFIFSVVIAGSLMERFGRSIPLMAAAMLLGLLVCYAFGTAWFLLVYTKTNSAIGIGTALSWCVVPFIVPDCGKIALAILLVKRLYKHMPFNRNKQAGQDAA